MNTPLIIAHRGESIDAPENTLAAINLAWKRNVKAVEIDIHLTVDNKIVVIHDKTTFRVSGIRKVVRKSTLNHLKLIDVGSKKGDSWKNEKIPLLSEVLSTVPENGKLIIEIKSNHNILRHLVGELSDSKLKDNQIELISFNIKTLTIAKKLMPKYNMLWLLNLDYTWPCWLIWINNKRIIRKVKNSNLDGINVWAGKILTKKFITEIKNEGLLIYSWTVDDIQKAQLLADYGINGITSGKAAWMTKQIFKR